MRENFVTQPACWPLQTISWPVCVKATVENPKCSVEKLSPKESVKSGNTALRDHVRAPEGFSEGKPEAAKPRGHSPRGLAAEGLPRKIQREPSHCPAAQCRHPNHSPEGTVIPLCPRIFNSCSEPQTTKFLRFTGK